MEYAAFSFVAGLSVAVLGWVVLFFLRNHFEFTVTKIARPLRLATGPQAHGIAELTGPIPEYQEFETIRKRLEDSEERFRGTFEQAAVGISHVSLTGQLMRINERFAQIAGYPKEELEKLTFQTITHPQDLDADLDQYKLLLSDKIKTYQMDKRYLRKDGNIVWVNLTVSLVRNPDKSPKYAIAVVQDITDRKTAEEKLKVLGEDQKILLAERTRNLGEEIQKRLETQSILEQRESLLRLITDALPAAVLYVDSNFTFRFVNQSYATWIGKSQKEILGRPIKEIIGSTIFNELLPAMTKVLLGELVSVDLNSNQKGSSHLDILPDVDVTGSVRGFIVLAVDTTAAVAAQKELEKAKIAADAANQLKSAFLANMTHEIRTPLAAILGFSELMNASNIDGSEKKQYAETVRRNGALLSTIVNDVLDLSKVEANKMEFELFEVSPLEVVQDVVSLLSIQASEKGVDLKFHSEGSIPRQIYSDPVRLRQILLNIVGNAIKFTTKGSVTITVKQLWENHPLKVGFLVEDTGCGVTEDQRQRLFRPFSQADATTQHKYGGTGLGLVLSKRLAQMLGGDVELVRSVSGEGSVFLVSVEIGQINEGAIESSKSSSLQEENDPMLLSENALKSVRILLVEDSIDIQVLLKTFLKCAGAHVDAAENGREALERARSQEYDLVLMDIQMPIMDGHEAMQNLRKEGFNKPIVALSAHAMKAEQERCLANGFNDCIPKPVARDVLIGRLAHFAQKNQYL